MPKGMQEIGTQMHRSASKFAIEVQNSSATGDVRPALLALSKTMQACVACHAGYRLK
jgi:cytochrome c556